MTTWRSDNVGRGHEACDPDWIRMCGRDAEEEITRWALEQGPAPAIGSTAAGPCSSVHQDVRADTPPPGPGDTAEVVGGVPTLTEIAQQLRVFMDVFSQHGMHHQRMQAYRLAYDVDERERFLNSGGAA